MDLTFSNEKTFLFVLNSSKLFPMFRNLKILVVSLIILETLMIFFISKVPKTISLEEKKVEKNCNFPFKHPKYIFE